MYEEGPTNSMHKDARYLAPVMQDETAIENQA